MTSQLELPPHLLPMEIKGNPSLDTCIEKCLDENMDCAYARIMNTAIEHGYPSEARNRRFNDYVRSIHFRKWMDAHGPKDLTLAQAAVLYVNISSWQGAVDNALAYSLAMFNGNNKISFRRFMQHIKMPDKRYLEGVVNLPDKLPYPEMLSSSVRSGDYAHLLVLMTEGIAKGGKPIQYDPKADIAYLKNPKGKRNPQADLMKYRKIVRQDSNFAGMG